MSEKDPKEKEKKKVKFAFVAAVTKGKKPPKSKDYSWYDKEKAKEAERKE